MQEFVTREEFDLVLRVVTDHRRAQAQRLADLERWFAECGRREATFRAELLRLRSVCRSLLSPRQRELFDAEIRGGVHDGDTLTECFDDVDAARRAAPIDDAVPHVWKPGDLCHVVIQEFARADSLRSWQVFWIEAEADDFIASLAKSHRPNDCDAVLTRKTLAQVTGVDTLANKVTSFDEHTIVI